MSVDLRLLFPMSDAESARFMRLKARCLRRAGFLDSAQHQVIQQRVERLLARAQKARPATAATPSGTERSARTDDAPQGAEARDTPPGLLPGARRILPRLSI